MSQQPNNKQGARIAFYKIVQDIIALRDELAASPPQQTFVGDTQDAFTSVGTHVALLHKRVDLLERALLEWAGVVVADDARAGASNESGAGT